jgi:hypothetical protein
LTSPDYDVGGTTEPENALRRSLMRHTRLIAAAAVLLAACGDDTTGLRVETIADLAGTWDVLVWEYSLAYDVSQKNDWVATQSLNGTLYIEPNGDFAMLVEFPWGFGVNTVNTG